MRNINIRPLLHRTNLRWRFRKILWPPQNIWTLIKISLVKTPQLIKIYYLFRDESKAATMIRLIKKDILTESSMDEGGNHVYHLFFIWIGAKKAPFPFCFDHWFPFNFSVFIYFHACIILQMTSCLQIHDTIFAADIIQKTIVR